MLLANTTAVGCTTFTWLGTIVILVAATCGVYWFLHAERKPYELAIAAAFIIIGLSLVGQCSGGYSESMRAQYYHYYVVERGRLETLRDYVDAEIAKR